MAAFVTSQVLLITLPWAMELLMRLDFDKPSGARTNPAARCTRSSSMIHRSLTRSSVELYSSGQHARGGAYKSVGPRAS